MLDPMFSFIDPIVEPIEDEDNLFHFIAQLDAFLDFMEEKGEPVRIQRPLTEETYKEMWMLRYEYQLGKLSFPELLNKYEEMLGISLWP